MRACATASVSGVSLLAGVLAVEACHEAPGPDVPPVTVALPGSASALAIASASAEPPVKAVFVDAPAKIEASGCVRVLVAAVKGKLTAMKEALGPGDVIVLAHAPEVELAGSGLAVVARAPITPCVVVAGLATEKSVVRASSAPELTWANGTMRAHLDVGQKVSPEVYMGRLEGPAAVPEHTHPGTWEILAAVEAAGAFTVAGVDQRLGPRQVVVVPPDTKHAYTPDPGSKLVAIQMYAPPGPEQRFVALAAAAKDAGAPPADAGRSSLDRRK